MRKSFLVLVLARKKVAKASNYKARADTAWNPGWWNGGSESCSYLLVRVVLVRKKLFNTPYKL